MNEKQTRIHTGLKSLGTDLDVFYQEGVNIYNGNSPLKAHFLAHCAREIDSMIRDTFSTDANKKLIEKKLKANKEDRKGLISSILACLGIEDETAFARKWYDVSNNFAEVAHRNGRSKEPRTAQEGMNIWDAYEDILDELVGNYYSLKRVVDNSFGYINLTAKDRDGNIKVHDIIDRLPFLLNLNAIKFYFFYNLESETWLIPLYEKGFFCPERIQYQFTVGNQLTIPNWIEGYYLIKVAKLNVSINDIDINRVLNEIINSYILYVDKEGNSISNLTADGFMAELICLIPENEPLLSNKIFFLTEQISKQQFLPDIILTKYLEILIQHNSLNLLKSILLTLFIPIKLKNTELEEQFFEDEGITYVESADSYGSPIRAQSLYHLFKHIVKIRAILGDQFVENLIGIVEDFYQYEPYLFNQHEISEVNYATDKNYFSGSPFKTLVQVTFAFLNIDATQLSAFIPLLLDSNSTILQRIFLKLVKENFTKLKDVFLTHITTFLNNVELISDLKTILVVHTGDFTVEEVTELIGKIDLMLTDSKGYLENISPEEILQFRAYTILPFLKLFEASNTDLVYPYTQKWSSELPSHQLDQENTQLINQQYVLLDLSNLNLKEVIQVLQNETLELYNELTLSNLFFEDVQNDSHKYFTHLNSLKNIRPVFRNAILSAARSMSNANTFVYWNELFAFIKDSVLMDSFCIDNKEDYRFISDFCALAIEKTVSEDSAVSLELTSEIIDINLELLKIIKPELENIQGLQNKIRSNGYFYVLDSLLVASLRWGRNELKDETIRFYPNVKETLTELLRTQNSIELHYALGKYLRNVAYLDFDWYLQMLPNIFPEPDHFWFSSFSAYLTQTPHLYAEVFKRLEAEYCRAILNPQLIDNTNLAAIMLEHAVMHHLHFKEEAETSLLDSIVQNCNPKLIRMLVRYVAGDRLAHNFLPDNDLKIRSLWREIHQRTIDLENSEDKRYILGALGNWVMHITHLDKEIFGWLETSFENEKDLNTLAFFDALLLHVEYDPESVGKLLVVYSSYVKGHSNFIYGIEKLTILVHQLYQKGYKDLADQICDCLGRKGFNDFDHIFSLNHKR